MHQKNEGKQCRLKLSFVKDFAFARRCATFLMAIFFKTKVETKKTIKIFKN